VFLLFAFLVDRHHRQSESLVHHVGVYGVTGGTAAKVVYLVPLSADGSQGGGQASATVTLPWSASFTANEPVSFRLSASAVGSGALRCTLTLDGKLVQTRSGTRCSVAVTPGP
jgi:hypothetical protein